jgi:hypothetical protein
MMHRSTNIKERERERERDTQKERENQTSSVYRYSKNLLCGNLTGNKDQ